MPALISLQETLRPALPQVVGCKDYAAQERLLQRVDRLLREAGLERLFVSLSLEAFERRAHAAGTPARPAARARHAHQSERALRCMILKQLLGVDYRALSESLAHSPLFRWFGRIEEFPVIRPPSKSTLQEYAHWLEAEAMEAVLAALTRALGEEEQARAIGLEAELSLEVAWVDSTALKAAIHFPTDWVLLRDAVRTLVRTVQCIRRHGLKRRMPEPASFLARINALSMGLSAAGRRQPGGKKERKALLRQMKAVVRVVGAHGRRYREALDAHWEQTDLSRKEAEVILRRLDNVLDQLPQVVRQAHERIIGERPLPNAEKILSLYDPDVRVIVRGKAGAEVEFGNSLLVAESAEGYILDHELRRESSPGDAKWLQERWPGLKERSGGRLCAAVADRGFDSAATRRMLEAEEDFNGITPRDPRVLQERRQSDEIFVAAQQRRAQTEGRIGILKNVFLEGTPRAKGFAHRRLQVAWAVLAHNLWVVARRLWREEELAPARAA